MGFSIVGIVFFHFFSMKAVVSIKKFDGFYSCMEVYLILRTAVPVMF